MRFGEFGEADDGRLTTDDSHTVPDGRRAMARLRRQAMMVVEKHGLF